MNKKEQEKNIKTIKIEDLIALTYFVEEYRDFKYDLEELIASSNASKKIKKIYNVGIGKFVIGSDKYKKFCEDYKHIINIMTKKCSFADFTINNYDEYGKERQNSSFSFFENYLLDHKENIEEIRQLLLALKNLKFITIAFDENMDFQNEVYRVKKEAFNETNTSFEYLDNIKCTPNFKYDTIEYTTEHSNYRMTLSTYLPSTKVYNAHIIYLNSLLFSVDRLPKSITKEETLDVILKADMNKHVESRRINEAANINLIIEQLTKDSFVSNEKIKCMDNIEQINKIRKELSSLKNIISNMQKYGKEFELSITTSYEEVTQEMIDKEKERLIHKN